MKLKKVVFLFEEINEVKKQWKPTKVATSKKMKVESLLSMEISLTNSSDADEDFLASPTTLSHSNCSMMRYRNSTMINYNLF